MGRKTIPDGTGMLFAFTADQRMLFWMKNTPHPLSIAYIDSEGIIREIYDMTPLSLETVASERSLRYALEVPQGWFSRVGIARSATDFHPKASRSRQHSRPRAHVHVQQSVAPQARSALVLDLREHLER